MSQFRAIKTDITLKKFGPSPAFMISYRGTLLFGTFCERLHHTALYCWFI